MNYLTRSLTILSLSFFFLSANVNAQCVLPSGSYQWGLSDLDNYVNSNCGGTPVDIIIPTDATINIKNNDQWNLSSYGTMTLTIEGNGSLSFNGSDQLTLASGSNIIVEDTSNPKALDSNGAGTNVKILIGSTCFNGTQFPAIIVAGGANEGGVLPVELVSFHANIVGNNKTVFRWITSAEINNSHFEIQHSSDGYNFEYLGTIEGQGTSSEINQYTFSITTPFNDVNYYRLKQVDFDGKHEYSEVISTKFIMEEQYELIANSVNTLKFFIQNESEINVFSLSGQLVFSEKIYEGIHEFPFSNFVPGNYAVFIKSNRTYTQNSIMISRHSSK